MKRTALHAGVSAMLFLSFACLTHIGVSQPPQKPHPTGPWMNTSLSPDERAVIEAVVSPHLLRAMLQHDRLRGALAGTSCTSSSASARLVCC